MSINQSIKAKSPPPTWQGLRAALFLSIGLLVSSQSFANESQEDGVGDLLLFGIQTGQSPAEIYRNNVDVEYTYENDLNSFLNHYASLLSAASQGGAGSECLAGCINKWADDRLVCQDNYWEQINSCTKDYFAGLEALIRLDGVYQCRDKKGWALADCLWEYPPFEPAKTAWEDVKTEFAKCRSTAFSKLSDCREKARASYDACKAACEKQTSSAKNSATKTDGVVLELLYDLNPTPELEQGVCQPDHETETISPYSPYAHCDSWLDIVDE
jgi:hypothetical protein